MDRLTIRQRLLFVVSLATLCLTLVLVSFGIFQKQREIYDNTQQQVQSAIWALSKSLPLEAQGFAAGTPSADRINGLIADDAQINISEGVTDAIFAGTGVHVTYFRFLPDTQGFTRVMTSIQDADGKRAVGTPLDPKGSVLPVLLRGEIYAGAATILGEKYLTRYEPVYDGSGQMVGAVFAGKSIAQVNANLFSDAAWFAGLAVVLNLTAILGALVLTNHAMRPLRRLANTVDHLKAQNFDIEIPHVTMKDEVGSIAKSLADMRESLITASEAARARDQSQSEQSDVVNKLTQALQQLANGDLSKQIDESFADSYEVLRGFFNETVEKMRSSVAQIAQMSERIQAQSGDMTKSSEELAHRTEVQAATLEQTAAAMEEMTASFKSAATSLREVETIVGGAQQDADKSGTVVTEAISAMEAIEKSSSQITQIIGVIDDIAFQTNLLALNAGVEAARAGESGRGFAVVASEVGALAQRASAAAKEIKDLISTSTQHVESGVDRVRQAGIVLQQIARRVADISSLTANIATGAQEQSIGLNEINLGMTQLDQATQQNAAMAEESNAASQLMAQSAEELGQLVTKFTLSSEPSVLSSGTGFVQMASPAPQPFTPLPAARQRERIEVDLGNLAPQSQDAAIPPAKVANSRGVWQDF